MLFKETVLNDFVKLKGKQLRWSHFLINISATNRMTPLQVLSSKFLRIAILKNTSQELLLKITKIIQHNGEKSNVKWKW